MRRQWLRLGLLGAAAVVLVASASARPGPQPSASPGPPVTADGPISTGDQPSAVASSAVAASAVPSGASGFPIPSQTGATVTAAPTGSSTPAPTTGPTPPGPTLAPTARPATAPTVPPTIAPTPATGTPGPTAAPIPPLSACPVFPKSNVWNRRVDGLAVAANSDAMIAAIGLAKSLHPDFSDAGGYGIPVNVVGASTPRSVVTFQYDDESDPGPYPIPATPRIEGGSDRHLLMVDTDDCILSELYAATKTASGWQAGSGAMWDLGSNALRPDGWTSADAAGLPIFPGLVRYAEVKTGAINHAIRFTAPSTCAGYIYPATHEAGSGSCSSKPPMGLRVRLKASVDISGYGPQSRVILLALQRYGMLLADNGSAWYITGSPDSRWDDDELHGLGGMTGADFEVVDTTGFVNG